MTNATATQPTLTNGMASTMQEPQLSVSGSNRTLHSIDDFADRLGKKLGQHYGMADIRD